MGATFFIGWVSKQTKERKKRKRERNGAKYKERKCKEKKEGWEPEAELHWL